MWLLSCSVHGYCELISSSSRLRYLQIMNHEWIRVETQMPAVTPCNSSFTRLCQLQYLRTVRIIVRYHRTPCFLPIIIDSECLKYNRTRTLLVQHKQQSKNEDSHSHEWTRVSPSESISLTLSKASQTTSTVIRKKSVGIPFFLRCQSFFWRYPGWCFCLRSGISYCSMCHQNEQQVKHYSGVLVLRS